MFQTELDILPVWRWEHSLVSQQVQDKITHSHQAWIFCTRRFSWGHLSFYNVVKLRALHIIREHVWELHFDIWIAFSLWYFSISILMFNYLLYQEILNWDMINVSLFLRSVEWCWDSFLIRNNTWYLVKTWRIWREICGKCFH